MQNSSRIPRYTSTATSGVSSLSNSTSTTTRSIFNESRSKPGPATYVNLTEMAGSNPLLRNSSLPQPYPASGTVTPSRMEVDVVEVTGREVDVGENHSKERISLERVTVRRQEVTLHPTDPPFDPHLLDAPPSPPVPTSYAPSLPPLSTPVSRNHPLGAVVPPGGGLSGSDNKGYLQPIYAKPSKPKTTHELLYSSEPSPLVRGVTSGPRASGGAGSGSETGQREAQEDDPLRLPLPPPSTDSKKGLNSRKIHFKLTQARDDSPGVYRYTQRVMQIFCGSSLYAVSFLVSIISLLVGLLFISIGALHLQDCPYSEGLPILAILWGSFIVAQSAVYVTMYSIERCCPERWEISAEEYSTIDRPAARTAFRLKLVSDLKRTNLALGLQAVERILQVCNIGLLIAAIALLIHAYHEAGDEWPADQNLGTGRYLAGGSYYRTHNYHNYYGGSGYGGGDSYGAPMSGSYDGRALGGAFCDPLLYNAIFYYTAVVVCLAAAITALMLLLLIVSSCCACCIARGRSHRIDEEEAGRDEYTAAKTAESSHSSQRSQEEVSQEEESSEDEPEDPRQRPPPPPPITARPPPAVPPKTLFDPPSPSRQSAAAAAPESRPHSTPV